MRCNAGHVWMNAEMLVVPHPYYVVTDQEGNFRLTNGPAGEYEIEAWHEGWKVVGQGTVYDVLMQVRVQRPVFSDPVEWTKKVLCRPMERSIWILRFPTSGRKCSESLTWARAILRLTAQLNLCKSRKRQAHVFPSGHQTRHSPEKGPRGSHS